MRLSRRIPGVLEGAGGPGGGGGGGIHNRYADSPQRITSDVRCSQLCVRNPYRPLRAGPRGLLAKEKELYLKPDGAFGGSSSSSSSLSPPPQRMKHTIEAKTVSHGGFSFRQPPHVPAVEMKPSCRNARREGATNRKEVIHRHRWPPLSGIAKPSCGQCPSPPSYPITPHPRAYLDQHPPSTSSFRARSSRVPVLTRCQRV